MVGIFLMVLLLVVLYFFGTLALQLISIEKKLKKITNKYESEITEVFGTFKIGNEGAASPKKKSSPS